MLACQMSLEVLENAFCLLVFNIHLHEYLEHAHNILICFMTGSYASVEKILSMVLWLVISHIQCPYNLSNQVLDMAKINIILLICKSSTVLGDFKPCYIATFSACELVSGYQIHYYTVLMINIKLSLLLPEEGFD